MIEMIELESEFMNELNELTNIVQKFSESQWELLDEPSKKWLVATKELLIAIRSADSICGQCGCEFDELYKKALGILNDSFKTSTI